MRFHSLGSISLGFFHGYCRSRDQRSSVALPPLEPHLVCTPETALVNGRGGWWEKYCWTSHSCRTSKTLSLEHHDLGGKRVWPKFKYKDLIIHQIRRVYTCNYMCKHVSRSRILFANNIEGVAIPYRFLLLFLKIIGPSNPFQKHFYLFLFRYERNFWA